MSVIETIESTRSGLMWICLSALAAIATGVVGACLYRGVASAMRRLMTVIRLAAFVVISAFCVMRGGAKFLMPPPSTGGTPVVQVVQSPATGGTPVVPVVVTPEEIAQGWRLESVVTNDAVSYAMPEGVSPSFNWHKRGTFGEWSRLELGDFAFPLGADGEAVTSFSVFNDGRIRPTPRDAVREICAVGVPMLAMQGASRFWVGETAAVAGRPPYRAKRLTWENFFLNADTNTPVNAQIELFQNGDFTTRSNEVERVYRRVEPFDWDGDGLENSVDPDTLVAGSDAHGTNAEWYNTVCSNVLEAVAGGSTGTTGILPVGNGGTGTTGILPVGGDCVLSWRADVNSNAYYFVDVVTTNGLAPIYFTGDRDSRLGNPVVVARGGETNRVPLLIGVDYAVTSDAPFAISFPIDYIHPTVTTNSVADYNVRWPLNFVFTESLTESNRVYAVTVEPYDPGGVLTWEGGGMRSGASSGCGCGCLGCIGYSVVFNCPAICTCHGECKAIGRYVFENALFTVTGGECRCGFDDPLPDSPPSPHEPNDPPSLTISFSKPAVIFEDSFLEKPGVMMPRRSTRVRLTIDAYGGSGGGTFSVTGVKMSKLFAIGGNVVLPYGDELPPGGSYHATGVYEGAEGSDEMNDVEVQGSLVPRYYPYNPSTSTAALTSVKVALTAEFIARDNPCQTRHTYGVGEKVKFTVTPALSVVNLRAVKWDISDRSTPYDTFSGIVPSNIPDAGTYLQVYDADASAQRVYICPATATSPNISVAFNGVEYRPAMAIVEPGEVVSQTASGTWDVGFGHVGFGHLTVENFIGPFHVSFRGVGFAEIPCDEAVPPTGYYATTNYTGPLTHTFRAGAGNVSVIGNGNYWCHDDAGSDSTIINWSSGTLVWKIPIGWVRFQSENNPQDWAFECDYERHRDASSRPLLVGGRTDAYMQTFHIDADGTTTLEKLGWRMTRSRWSFSGTVEKMNER